jgi:AcrR family transcriptional regulator
MSVQSTKGKRTVLDKETRRHQIVNAAIDVFASKGYRVASITDIIEAAGVARGTFYLYFESKEEVFNAVLDRFHELFREMAKKETARSYRNPFKLEARLREAFLDWLRFLLRHRRLTEIVFRQAAAVDPDYEKKYLEIVKAMQAHSARAIRFLQTIRVLRADLDPQFLNTVFHGVATQVALKAIAEKSEPDLEAIADQTIKLLRSGVLRSKKE